MAIHFLDGLDLHSTVKDLARRGWIPGTNGTVEIIPNGGRFGTGFNAVRLRGNAFEVSRAYLTMPFTGALSTWVVQGAFNFGQGQTAGTPTDAYIFQALTRQTSGTIQSSSVGVTLGYNHSLGQFEVRRGGTLGTGASGILIQSAAFTMNDATFYHIELKIVQSATVGTIDLIVNGSSLISVTGQNTGTIGMDVMLFGVPGGNTNRRSLDIDDIVVSDVFLGNRRVYTLSPNADTANADFVPDTGTDHFARVNEKPSDGDTSYVSSSTVNAFDAYNIADLTVTPGDIDAVQVSLIGRKADAGVRTDRIKTISGATTDNGAPNPVGTNYDMAVNLHVLNPNGSVVWSRAAVDALKIGVELTS